MRATAAARLATLWLLCGGGCHAAEVHVKVPTAVRVQAVACSAARAATRYSASIHPATTVDMAFRVGGYVEAIAEQVGVGGRRRLLQEGDAVRRGSELARVRRADYLEKLGEATAARAEALASRDQARIDFARATRLVASHSVAQAELDVARARLSGANARVAGANVRVSEARTALADTSLRAPLDGIVLARHLELGALVPPGATAFTLADVGSVRAVFGVPDMVVETLQLGTAQRVVSEGTAAGDVHGTITRISPSADAKSRVFEVEVSIANAQGALKPGMVVSLPLASPQAEAAAAVAVLPLTAVVRAPAGARSEFAVFVLEHGAGGPVARLREVALGEFLGNVIPIRSGVASGEEVVVSGASFLSDGEQVQLIPADAP